MESEKNILDYRFNRGNQQATHAKEAAGIEALKKHFGARLVESTAQQDLVEGWDVAIDGVKYDVKFSNSRKLSLFRQTVGEWYCPVTKYLDVSLLYMVKNDEDNYICFVIDKSKLLDYVFKHAEQIKLTSYSRDGNKQINLHMEDWLTDLTSKYFIIKEEEEDENVKHY